MDNFFANLSHVIAQHAGWAPLILGLITFGESMVIIGAFFPATVLMLAAGGLVGAGVLHPVPVILGCVAGAVLGDAVSYALGRKIGWRALAHPVLKPHRRKLARARLFFIRFGAASIYICRFMGPVRAFVPMIAGMTYMGSLRFQVANVCSAAIWVPIMLAPGYLAAKGIDGLGPLSAEYGVTLVAASVIGLTLLGVWGWRVLQARGGNTSDASAPAGDERPPSA